MEVVILVVHLFVAVAMIGMILLQRSEGGALGIGGGGTGGGLFSARGAANALTRTTAFLAAAFFATSILLTVLANMNHEGSKLVAPPTPTEQPATPVTPSPYDPVNGSPANPATAPGGEPSGAPGDQPAAPPASGPTVPTPTQPSTVPATPPATPPADKPKTP